MRFTTLGKSETKISQIGLGTWQFGSKGWGFETDFNKKDAIGIVHRALELGVNLIDTAEVYGMGESERIIGQALEGYEREKIVIISKFLPATIRPSAVKRALTKSLKRLQIDYLDVYLIHWPNPLLPLGATLKHMEKMVDDGLIRHIGMSNFGLKRFQKAQSKMKKYTIEVDQLNYSMAKSKVKNSFFPYAEEHGITVMAYSPLGQGYLTGKYNPNNTPSGTRRRNRLFRKSNFKRGVPLLEELNLVAQEHNATMAEVALSWLIHNKQVVAIPGAKSISQLEANVNAAELSLTEAQLSRLNHEVSKFNPKLLF
ncbi:MAG: aldo/keto reductase [Candidatus Hodarchaeales archaeon]|jgi:aryl-alcohol dehydrogenase-like predicted oxidoreductase